MKSVTVPVLVSAIEQWIAELMEVQASGQYESGVAHTVASMQTSVNVIRHMLNTTPQVRDD